MTGRTAGWRRHRLLRLILVIGLIAGCAQSPASTAAPGTASNPATSAATAAPASPAGSPGGTLRVGATSAHNPFGDPEGRRALDPQWEYGALAFELFRCCLLRTLLSYNGRPAAEGGTLLNPDLAVALPEISADGLTWTFRLKPGLRYGPPLDDMEIVAGDIVRALERTLTPLDPQAGTFIGGYSFYYDSVIAGATEFASGEATRIAGLEAPDARTLIVRLNEPNGELGHLFALPATAPIPPLPGDPAARFGIATGLEEGFGQRIVASGPYMYEGSERLDFTRPAADQPPVQGFVPGDSLTLVRNPSWDRATDALRTAAVDRIEVTFGMPNGWQPGPDGAAWIPPMLERLARGELDLLVDIDSPPDQVAGYLADPARADQVHVVDADYITMIPLNLAQPPFDDIHVRRAVNLALDRAALARLRSPVTPVGPFASRPHDHLAPDSLLGNLLLGYDPFPSRDGAADLAAAKRELAASAYDTDGDGVCDAAACRNVAALVNPRPGTQAVAEAVMEPLRALGLELTLEQAPDPNAFFERLYDASAHLAISIDVAFLKDYPSADTFFAPLFYRGNTDEYWNPMAIGVRPDELEAAGYEPLEIPNVDARIDACHAQIGQAQLECWAEFDQYLTETLVVAVPFGSFQSTRVVSDRVERFSFDQFTSAPALDQIVLAPE